MEGRLEENRSELASENGSALHAFSIPPERMVYDYVTLYFCIMCVLLGVPINSLTLIDLVQRYRM